MPKGPRGDGCEGDDLDMVLGLRLNTTGNPLIDSDVEEEPPAEELQKVLTEEERFKACLLLLLLVCVCCTIDHVNS